MPSIFVGGDGGGCLFSYFQNIFHFSCRIFKNDLLKSLVANKAKTKVVKARTCFWLADFNAKFSLFRPKVLETTLIAINSISVYWEKKRKSLQINLWWHRLTSRRYMLQHKRLSQQFFNQLKDWFHQRSIQGQALTDEVIMFNLKISVWHNKT